MTNQAENQTIVIDFGQKIEFFSFPVFGQK